MNFYSSNLRYTGKFCETKIVCPENYYGDDCSVYCIAQDTCEIHTKCDYYGRLQCIDGWSNFPYCNKRLIPPALDPTCPPFNQSCLNGGSCWQNKCCCLQTYSGPRCEIQNDPCINSPCGNNGVCIAQSSSFKCSC